MKSTYFTTCANCGANLDPGERCSCLDYLRIARDQKVTELRTDCLIGQFGSIDRTKLELSG